MDNSKKEKRRHGSIIIGKAETSAVARSKFALLALLTMMTVCVSTLVYSYVKQHELTIFHENFVDDSHKVLGQLGTTIDLTLESIDAFIVNQMSFAKYANMTWPFVTVPDFGVKASKIQSISRAKYVCDYLIIEGYGFDGGSNQRTEWMNYTSKNNDWVEHDLMIQKED